MRLYLREKQLELLDHIFNSVDTGSNFILLSGRRKVGKTTLAMEHLRKRRGAYLTVNLKPTRLQLTEINNRLRSFHLSETEAPVFTRWEDFFEYLFFISKDGPVNIALDDFHNFDIIEPEFLNAFAVLWEKHARDSYLNLIAITGDQRFISKYFNSEAGPLRHINIASVKLTPFVFPEVARIMQMNESMLTLPEIMKIYMTFGGHPKYYVLIDQFDLWNNPLPDMLRELVFKKFAPLYFDIREMIYTQFRSSSSQHFQILEAMAAGNSCLSEIAAVAGLAPTAVMKYLHELEFKKELIKKKVPVAAPGVNVSRSGRYTIVDYFYNFWFRFVQPSLSIYEMGHYDSLMADMEKLFPVYVQKRIKFLIRELVSAHIGHPFLSELFDVPVHHVGESWTREHNLELVISNDDSKRALFGKLFTSPLQYSAAGLNEFREVSADVHRLFPAYTPHQLILGWDHPPKLFAEMMQEQHIKHLHIHDLLGLTGYKPKPIRAVKSRAERVRKLEPVAERLQTAKAGNF